MKKVWLICYETIPINKLRQMMDVVMQTLLRRFPQNIRALFTKIQAKCHLYLFFSKIQELAFRTSVNFHLHDSQTIMYLIWLYTITCFDLASEVLQNKTFFSTQFTQLIFELKIKFFKRMCIKKQQSGASHVGNFVDFNRRGLILVCVLKTVLIIPLPMF